MDGARTRARAELLESWPSNRWRAEGNQFTSGLLWELMLQRPLHTQPVTPQAALWTQPSKREISLSLHPLDSSLLILLPVPTTPEFPLPSSGQVHRTPPLSSLWTLRASASLSSLLYLQSYLSKVPGASAALGPSQALITHRISSHCRNVAPAFDPSVSTQTWGPSGSEFVSDITWWCIPSWRLFKLSPPSVRTFPAPSSPPTTHRLPDWDESYASNTHLCSPHRLKVKLSPIPLCFQSALGTYLAQH